jgi:excisionase family DNA binding protein
MTMENTIAPLLTSEEVGKVLGIHPKVVERMAKRGELPGLKVGRFWRYQSAALAGWIDSRVQSDRTPCRTATSL